LSQTLFFFYSEYVTNEALEGFQDFKTERQVIHTVKYADYLVILTKKEIMLQGTADRLTETDTCYEMEMNVEKTKVMRISRQPSPVHILTNQKQMKNVEYFKYLANMTTDDAICTHEINCRIAIAKAAFNKITLFTSKLNLILRDKLIQCYIWNIAFMVLKHGHFRHTWKISDMWCWKMEKISLTDCIRN
jgi:hypothetical protein